MLNKLATRITELFGIDYPVIQEGMGPFRTVELAAAVSAAGGLGTVSMPGMTQDLEAGGRTLREHIEQVASLTDRPFAVNVPVGRDDSGTVLPVSGAYIRAVIAARESDAAIAAQLRVLTTSAGSPGEFRTLIADAGLLHMHKVGSTAHALKAESAGVDVLIASGYEMGGHTQVMPVHTFVLVPNVTQAVSVPVVLSGGARDGRTLAAALALGADAVAMGTRFIASQDNSSWHPAYAGQVLSAREGDDVVFPAVYGPARGLRNNGVTELLHIIGSRAMTQAELTRWKDERMTAAQACGQVEDGLLPMGQVASAITDIIQVAEFIPRIAREAADILTSLSNSVRGGHSPTSIS